MKTPRGQIRVHSPAARRPRPCRFSFGVAALLLAGLTSCSSNPSGAEKKTEPQGASAVTLQLTIEGGTAQDRDAVRAALSRLDCVAKVEPGADGVMTLTFKPDKPLSLDTLEETIRAVKPDPSGKGFRFDRRSLISGGFTLFNEHGHTSRLSKDALDTLLKDIGTSTGFKAEYRWNYMMNFRLTPKGARPEPLRKVFDLLEAAEQAHSTRFVEFIWNSSG